MFKNGSAFHVHAPRVVAAHSAAQRVPPVPVPALPGALSSVLRSQRPRPVERAGPPPAIRPRHAQSIAGWDELLLQNRRYEVPRLSAGRVVRDLAPGRCAGRWSGNSRPSALAVLAQNRQRHFRPPVDSSRCRGVAREEASAADHGRCFRRLRARARRGPVEP